MKMKMKTYKFRAECLPDVYKAMCLIYKNSSTKKSGPTNTRGFKLIPSHLPGGLRIPDFEVEFRSRMALKELKKLIAQIDDGHVMLETIELKENYTGERK